MQKIFKKIYILYHKHYFYLQNTPIIVHIKAYKKVCKILKNTAYSEKNVYLCVSVPDYCDTKKVERDDK